MYLPTTDARQRKDITEEFFHYRHLAQSKLWDEYSAYEHWAKIEVCIKQCQLVPILCCLIVDCIAITKVGHC